VFTADRECVYGLCIDPANVNRVLAVTDKGAYRSTDGGMHWTVPGLVFAGTSVIADPTVSGRFFAGALDGVYESTDGGRNWEKISRGLPTSKVTSLAYDVTTQRLVAGTYGNGMYRLSFIPTGVAFPGPIPENVYLEQNYPNPFNGTTVIAFRTPEQMPVKLEIFDMLGRSVAVPVSGPLEAGEHTAAFEAGTMASGTYLCRLTAGAAVLTRRMMLVR
jgi:hypothetical protein